MALKTKEIKRLLIIAELAATKKANGLSKLQDLALSAVQVTIANKVDEVVGFTSSNPASVGAIAKRLELTNLIRKEFGDLTVTQTKQITDHLIDIYNTGRVTISGKLGLPFQVTNDFQAKRLLEVGSNNMSLSARVWNNNQAIAERLNNDIGRLLYQGAKTDEIKTAIAKDFNISYNSADRLIRTETSRFYNASAVDSYKAAGITQIEFLAEIDACEEFCQPNDGKLFDITDNSNIPPLHPNCRCTILPVIKD